MKLSVWRPALMQWLTRKITYNSASLQTPTKDVPSVLFVPPLKNIYYFYNGTGIFGTGVQDINVGYWYDPSVNYIDLPLATLEGEHSTISQLLLRDVSAIAPITEAELIKLPSPVSVVEQQNTRNILVYLMWSLSIVWAAEPEVEDNTGVYTISRIEVALYDHKLTNPNQLTDWTTDKVLDWQTDIHL